MKQELAVSQELSILLIAAVALVGWWLALRPGSSYRAVASPISYMVVAAAILMCLLVISDQQLADRDGVRSAALSAPGP